MRCIKSKVDLALGRGNIHSDTSCPYHPCHYEGQNCSFCYCPFYPCNDADLGTAIRSSKGELIWDCSPCLFNHRNDVVEYSFKRFEELGIKDSCDPGIRDVFLEAKEKFYRPGRCIMVLGATSDAGKSVVTAAVCRILHRKGYVVTPFKSQNMSLNSRVTLNGEEISMIQELQFKAAGQVNPTSKINPILMKPKGDDVSEVSVNGRPIGDFNSKDYYEKFVPGRGIEVVRQNIDFLKGRYDYIVMEGAGSPAEINIYDSDIANMKAAEIADADCFLVVNMERGGSFAYAIGTIDLIPEKDRKRIKGVILNNLRGDADSLRPGIGEFERRTNIPILGIMPHLDFDLPKEDSECFNDSLTKGHGTKKVAVIRLPRMSNYTDLDPLCLEDVTMELVSSPDALSDADAVIIPGSNNPISDLQWMKDNGLFGAVMKIAGSIPILGICGGYEMMARGLFHDGCETKGLGLFDLDMRWDHSKRTLRKDSALLNINGGSVTGFETHSAFAENSSEEPLFTIEWLSSKTPEGAVNREKKLYGTFIHGLFERPAFREHFVSLMGCVSEGKDYSEYLNKNLDMLADGFEKAVDDRFWELLR